MNIHALRRAFPRCLLAACLLAPALPAAAAPPEGEVDATSLNCSAGKYAGKVRQIQQDLNRIYADDEAFKRSAGSGARPLDDGKLGSVTLHWLGTFCDQHPFKASAGNFDADVVAELARYRAAPAPAPKEPAPLPPVETIYRYDPAALRKPKDLEAILPRLRLLTDRYADRKQFDDAVGRTLPGKKLDPETLQQIERFSTVDGYVLPAAALDQLKGASPGLIDRLRPVAGVDYASADEFHLDLDAAAADAAEKAELSRYAAQIDQLARVVHYRIPATIAVDLSVAGELDPPIATLYASMAHIAYPSQDLFERALQARLERALDMCPQDRFRHDGKLADGDVKALWALVDGSDRLAEVMALRGAEHRCTPVQLQRATGLTRAGHEALYRRLDKAALLVTQGKAPDLPGQAGPGAVAGCGCAPSARQGVTYGVYPLWTDATRRQLDFDVLSRIGLYGMTVDDKGALNLPVGIRTLPWTLLEAAHRHMTRVDWIVSGNDWSGARKAGMASLLGNLRQSIVELLRTPFPHTDWRGTALATFGLEQGPSAGDGIALHFERFPGNPADQAALRDFVQALTHDLHAMKPARQLSLMLSQSDIVDESGDPGNTISEDRPFSAVNLHALMQKANPIDDDADPAASERLRADDLRVLVLIQEPTANEKLLLRADVEQALFSNQRVRVLRNIVPVLEYDGVRSGQLTDEIIYFQDNFGGIGFWPLAFSAAGDNDDGSASANHILHGYFARAGTESGVLAELTDLICPNRTWLRWLAWLTVILAVVATVTLARCRGCGTRLDSNAWYMAGMIALIILPFLVITALVVGDPLFRSESGVHWMIAAVLIGVVVVPGAYGMLKPARKVP